MLAPYTLALGRPRTQTIFDEAGRVQPDRVNENIDEYCALIARAAGEHEARLIAFPQFGLSGYAGVSQDDWAQAALDFSGPETARIAAAAKGAEAYVVIQAAEKHAAFPGRYFLSAAILTPEGQLGMVHRKNYTLSLRTSPIDVHDRFVAAFGKQAFYPVLETPLGRIGLSIGAEVHWPEAVRSLALRGAEIVINPVAAPLAIDYMGRPGAEAVRRVRAFENQVYLAMVNVAGESAPPAAVYDYDGRPIECQPEGESPFTLATIDLHALHAARGAPAANFLAELQPAIHDDLSGFDLWPSNELAAAPASDFGRLAEIEKGSWERLRARWS